MFYWLGVAVDWVLVWMIVWVLIGCVVYVVVGVFLFGALVRALVITILALIVVVGCLGAVLALERGNYSMVIVLRSLVVVGSGTGSDKSEEDYS